MQKTIEYKMNRVIDALPLTEELFAYSDKHYHNDTLVSEIEGIALKEALDIITFDDKIQDYSTEVRKGAKAPIDLFYVDIKEAARQYMFGSDKGNEEFRKLRIDKPYSYVSEFGLNENVCLMYLSYYDHNLYDVDFNIQPKAVFFDYIQANMHNRLYDLEVALSTLKKRDDITWVNGESKVIEAKIKKIPYYNAEEDLNEYLEFIWHPTDEDFEKVKDTFADPYARYENICKHVFGISKLSDF